MIKKIRFFAGFMKRQADWLNSMSDKGYRLVKTGKLEYEFEECEPGRYRYTVEYVGYMSFESEENYKAFLEECGYKVFYKNINLDYSTFKLVYRPGAEKGGRIATTGARSTYNKELLIVEKENDGKPFELHTEKNDLADYYRRLLPPRLFLAFMMLAGVILAWPILPAVIALGLLAAYFIGSAVVIGVRINRLEKNNNVEE